MKIYIDERSGFCFGVENAVSIAEKAIASDEEVYCLGTIVHNDIEVERLTQMGLKTVDHSQFSSLENCRVLIRAHGEPPATYETARANGITLIDATCPIVKRLQRKIKGVWESGKEDGRQIVIFGKKRHAEVTGLLGQTGNSALVLERPDDLEAIDYSRPIYLFSQTTMNRDSYEELKKGIQKRAAEESGDGRGVTVTDYYTICGQVACREPRLVSFAREHDAVLFVSGKQSSNGRMLFRTCRENNSSSHMISSPDEIKVAWFQGKRSTGISGATSTPRWLIRDVAIRVAEITGGILIEK